MESKKNDTNELIYKEKLTHGQGKFSYWKGNGKWWIRSLGLREHSTIYIINDKNLLYSSENYIHYLVITYMVKESEKEYIYIYTYIYVYTYTHIYMCMYV